MSRLEEHFKDSLTRAVANEPPVVDAWNRFERRARRDRRSRFAAAIVGVAAVAAASAVAIPRLVSNNSPVITQPSDSPTPDPYAGWETFTKDEHYYRVRVPQGWRVTSFEDVYEVIPDGLPGTLAGERTFAVSIAFFPGVPSASSPPDEPRDQSRESSGKRPDERPYTRWDLPAGDGSHSVRYDITWAPWTSCAPGGGATLCPKDPRSGILLVQIFGSDAELWDRYADIGEQVVASIEHLSGPTTR